MSRFKLGTIAGLLFGLLDVGLMMPLSFPDKRAALVAAFINRLSIGLVIGAAKLPGPGWAAGLFWGVLLSLADAVITKAYTPILIGGAIGGAIIRAVVSRFSR